MAPVLNRPMPPQLLLMQLRRYLVSVVHFGFPFLGEVDQRVFPLEYELALDPVSLCHCSRPPPILESRMIRVSSPMMLWHGRGMTGLKSVGEPSVGQRMRPKVRVVDAQEKHRQ